MKTYFLSSKPCALTINGAYFGMTDLFERHAELCLKDNLFLSFTPENARPISFFLNERIRTCAPARVNVYLADRFIMLHAFDFPPLSTAFQIHAQKTFENASVSVFSQGETQCVIQTKDRTHTFVLPSAFQECEISAFQEYFFIKSPTHLAVYHENGNCLFLEETHTFSIDENGEKPAFNATLPLSSALSRMLKGRWELTPDRATRTVCSLLQKNDIPQEELIGYAFLESLRLGEDPTPYLSKELVPDLDKIKNFLKGFTAVSITQVPNEYLLTYPVGERLFSLKKICVEVENSAIIDIKG